MLKHITLILAPADSPEVLLGHAQATYSLDRSSLLLESLIQLK